MVMTQTESGFGLVRPIQPALTGLDELAPARPQSRERAERVDRLAANDRRARRRYWSVRDLSRRLWLGRGYELLRELIRTGIVPANRSARSWWVDEADATGLIAAFDDRAGKVRAFRGLESWLRERCFVAPLTPETETILRLTRSGLAWRGAAYLPMKAWRPEPSPDGGAEYRHVSGLVVS